MIIDTNTTPRVITVATTRKNGIGTSDRDTIEKHARIARDGSANKKAAMGATVIAHTGSTKSDAVLRLIATTKTD